MTRDIMDRLELFMEGSGLEVDRLALNMDQITAYRPPPNPAKDTDSRFREYKRRHGDQSWELDALEPTVLAGLVRSGVMAVRDEELWEAAEEREALEKSQLKRASAAWDRIVKRMKL